MLRIIGSVICLCILYANALMPPHSPRALHFKAHHALQASSSSLDTQRSNNIFHTLWKFTRPHTILGSGLSVLSLFAFATPPYLWRTLSFWNALYHAMVPALFMNLYITGLNQVKFSFYLFFRCDVMHDRLPILRSIK